MHRRPAAGAAPAAQLHCMHAPRRRPGLACHFSLRLSLPVEESRLPLPVVTAAAVALNPPVTPGNDTLAPGQSFTLTPDPTQENVASISVSGDYSADNLSGAQSGSDYIFTDTNTADSNNNPGN